MIEFSLDSLTPSPMYFSIKTLNSFPIKFFLNISFCKKATSWKNIKFMHTYTHIKYIISNNIWNPDAKSKVFYPPSYILSNSTISYHLPFSLFLLIRRLESSSSSSYMFSIVNEKRDFCFVILAENGNNVYRVFISFHFTYMRKSS